MLSPLEDVKKNNIKVVFKCLDKPHSPRPGIWKKCLKCGSYFYTWNKLLSKNRGLYCSRKCSAQMQERKWIELECPTCHKKFLSYPYLVNKGRLYCSIKCVNHKTPKPMLKKKKLSRICRGCGSKFYRTLHDIRSGDATYCCKKCSIYFNNQRRRNGQQLECAVCKKIFYVRPIEIKRNRKCCSSKCQYMYEPNRIKSRDRLVLARKKGKHRDTNIEIIMKNILDLANIKYEHPYLIESNYYGEFDFAIPELRLAIETDGKYWHDLPEGIMRDKKKKQWCNKNSWTLLRFNDKQIIKSSDTCLIKILDMIECIKIEQIMSSAHDILTDRLNNTS